MQHRKTKGRFLVASAILLAGSAVVARAVPNGTATGGAGNAAGSGNAPPLLAQAFGQQFGGQGGFPGGGNQIAQGRQGGTFGTGGVFTLNTGQSMQQLAFCTDLLSDAPDETTRFTSGTGSLVQLADGRSMSLSDALASGLLAITGTHQPVRTLGISRLAFTLAFANTSGEPLRLSLTPGTAVTPAGQGAQPLPTGADKLFALAAEKRLSLSDTLQYAVWAARGSTAEEVEQANMRRLPASELARVQDLLQRSGIDRDFDRNRGLAAVRYDESVERIGSAGEQVTGTTLLADGTRAGVTAVRNSEGKGVVRLKPARGGEFFYAARFENQPGGKVTVKLAHLENGHAMQGRGSELVVSTNNG